MLVDIDSSSSGTCCKRQTLLNRDVYPSGPAEQPERTQHPKHLGWECETHSLSLCERKLLNSSWHFWGRCCRQASSAAGCHLRDKRHVGRGASSWQKHGVGARLVGFGSRVGHWHLTFHKSLWAWLGAERERQEQGETEGQGSDLHPASDRVSSCD